MFLSKIQFTLHSTLFMWSKVRQNVNIEACFEEILVIHLNKFRTASLVTVANLLRKYLFLYLVHQADF